MAIREAQMRDYLAIKSLLDQLGYPGTENFLQVKIKALLKKPDNYLFVWEENDKSLSAFIVLQFLVQLGLKGDIARIGYFSVDENCRSKGIGKQLEGYIEMLARERNCDRIEVHCHERRKDAHRFYYRQGYLESPKYLMKSLH